MFVLMNIAKYYGGKTEKTYLRDTKGAIVFWESRAEAEAMREQLDGGTVMHLGHNQYSNRVEVRRVRSNQLESDKFAKMVAYRDGMAFGAWF